MGNSVIWWYPQGSTTPETIDLGRKLSAINDQPTRDVADLVPSWGLQNRADFGGARVLRFAFDRAQRIRDAITIRQMRSMVTHLQAGEPIALCLDEDKTFGTWCRNGAPPQTGDSGLSTLGNQFEAFFSGSLTTGDEITIESPNPEMRREWQEFSSQTGTAITITGEVSHTFETEPVFVRYADFYPVLYLPSREINAAHPTTDRRKTWTWDVTLVEYPGAIEALNSQASALGNASGPKGFFQGLNSLGRAVSRGRETKITEDLVQRRQTRFSGGS